MPTYEYRCPQGHTFEVFHRMADDPPAACQICGEGPLTRVLYPAAIHFKGSGFYSTDYGRGHRRAGAKEGSESSGDGAEKKEDRKAESKEAAEA